MLQNLMLVKRSLLICVFVFAFIVSNSQDSTKAVTKAADTATVNAVDKEILWGTIVPGSGFELARTKYGNLKIGGYVLGRYINQMPANQFYKDHLGRTIKVISRNDIHISRILLNVMGYIYSPKLIYVFTGWAVGTTGQVAIIANLTYKFHPLFNLSVGVGGLPGTRSLLGSHPYWLAPDRTMADEFFRPGFTNGAWSTGALFSPKLFYKFMVGNNLSQLGINAARLSRDLATSGSIWWMPTTAEFGPAGAFGDYERHDNLATRFGACYTHSREDRYSLLGIVSPDNTQVRLTDGSLFFEKGSLAQDVTVQKADFNLTAADAAIKYKGFFLFGEFYYRTLTNFLSDGPTPISAIYDHGFQVQTSYTFPSRKIELYAATSFVSGKFGNSHEVQEGLNFYPLKTRNARVNLHVIEVDKSSVNSAFGYYTGGQSGTTISIGTSLYF